MLWEAQHLRSSTRAQDTVLVRRQVDRKAHGGL